MSELIGIITSINITIYKYIEYFFIKSAMKEFFNFSNLNQSRGGIGKKLNIANIIFIMLNSVKKNII